MFKRTRLAKGLLIAFGGTLALGASQSWSQTSPASGGDTAQRVEVTGSLIRRLESETAQQVVTIKVDELQKAGVTNAEQAVKFITQQQGGTVTSGSVSGTNGAAAYADLRSLGAQRTLVLLNGKRITQNPFATVAVDLNTLPLAAVDRIETLPDGASSTYGTDAIAGVINFITKKDYKGLSIGAQTQITEHGGADTHSGTLMGGIGDLSAQGWNVYGSLSFRQQRPMRGDERDFSRTSYIPSRGFNATSPTTFPANYSQGTLIANPTAPGCMPPSSIGVPEASGAAAGTIIRCFADTQVFTNTIPDQEQVSLFARGSLALGNDHTASLEFFHSKNIVTTQIAPSPESGMTMPTNSPYYPGNGITPANPALNPAAATCGALGGTGCISINWRTTVLGPRMGEQENNTQRAVAALEGNFLSWDYQASLLWSNAEVVNQFLNGYPTTTAMRGGVSGTARDAAGNQIWLNPFGPQDALGQAFLEANEINGKVQEGESTLQQAAFTLSRTFGSLAGGPIAIALGGELRTEEMVYRTDIAKVSQAASSGLAGSGALREGDRDIKALALELNLPVLKNLEIGAAVRYDTYSDFGNTVNPKLSFRFTPMSSLVIRGSANTGFSAPSLYQLYLPNSTTFTATRYNDPVLCPGGVPNLAAGAVAARDCGIQFQQLQGGKADLQPEESKAWSLGFVVQPTSNLTIGLDYWNYHLKDQISVIGEQSIFADPAKYASLYVRCSAAPADRRAAIGACQNPGTADPLAYVINTFLNLGDIRTSGFDLNANWNSGATTYGRFNASLRGSYVRKYRFQVEPNGAWFDPLGNYSAQFGGPVIRYQQVTSLGWEQGNWSALLVNRFVDGYWDQNNVAAGHVNKVGDWSTFDLSVTWRGYKGLTLGAGVLNLLDKEPPFSNQVSRFQARGYDDRFSNPVGRAFQLSAKYEF